ncbi:ribosome maturation factor RimP [Janibacter cremeus]|uniref:Ribosome maturation factor RimP n=1 Tax=Janibacter cremeus TaxID=1285192 RepID=A0A852VTG0_9MICO|nr:ribosome maturation factor RimP [Janibacter cremeus]NYF97115.1 ribosome maturation factor RimP [Janibacter cremeus]
MGPDQDVHEQVSAALGDDFVVDSVTVTPAGKRRVARIIVERPVAQVVGNTPVEPLTLDEIADATRLVSDALDSSDVMGDQPYTLEVSTPGTDRPLTEPVHFRRCVSRLVELRLTEGEQTGRVLAVTADGVDLHVKGTKKQQPHTAHIPFVEITKGIAQVEFSRPKSTSVDADAEMEA